MSVKSCDGSVRLTFESVNGLSSGDRPRYVRGMSRPRRDGAGDRAGGHSDRAGDVDAGDREPKTCEVCGRTIEWRASWAKNWAEVRSCSDACRRRRLGETDRQLEQAIETLLDARARTATICPSEAARVVGGEDWRPLMEPARMAARRLVATGRLEITQGGRVVDPSRAKGPIRLRRPR